VTPPQHIQALEKASSVRREHFAIRSALRAAEMSLPAALADSRAQRMTIEHVLCAQDGWGFARSWKALLQAGRLLWPDAIGPSPVQPAKLVGDLTDRERQALLRACGGGQ
jgi:hypothetical protein